MLDMIAGAVQALQTAKAAGDSAMALHGKLSALSQSVSSIEIREQLVALREQLVEVRNANITLSEKLAELERSQRMREQLTFDDPVYWQILDGAKVGPFCSSCWDGKTTLVRLHNNPYRGYPIWDCPVCRMTFHSQQALQAQDADVRAHNEALRDSYERI